MQTGEAYEDFVVHEHDAGCYNIHGEMVCEMEEIPYHMHNEDCYVVEKTLVCGLEETQGHTHDETCYEWERGDLICEIEDEEHEHGDECYEQIKVLTCQMDEVQEHWHDAGCYETSRTLVCDKRETPLHTHGESCFDEYGNWLCGVKQLEIHQHTDACWVWESDELNEEQQVISSSEEDIEQNTAPTIITMDESTQEADDMISPSQIEQDGEQKEIGDEYEEQKQQEEITEVQNNIQQEQEIITDDITENTSENDDEKENDANEETPEEEHLIDGIDEEKQEGEQLAEDSDKEIAEKLASEEITANRPEQKFEQQLNGVTVTVIAPEGAFPDGTTMELAEVTEEDVLAQIAGQVKGNVKGMYAVDIMFKNAEGTVIEPLKPIKVTMSSEDDMDRQKSSVVHYDKHGQTSIVEHEGEAKNVDSVTFQADDFSIYAWVQEELEETVLDSFGNSYTIRVTCGEDMEIPEGAHLAVSEVLQDTEGQGEYENYMEQAATAIEASAEDLSYIRIFDISILDAYEQQWQPPEGSTVQVSSALSDWTGNEAPKVVHFGDVPEIVEATLENEQVQFDASGFSVYVILDAPAREGDQAVTLRGGSYYLIDEYWEKSGRNLIKKSKNATDAATYYLRYDSTEGKYLIYCIKSGVQYYVQLTYNDDTRGGLKLSSDINDATWWAIEQYPGEVDGVCLISGELNGITYYWNQQGGGNGNGFAAWHLPNDANDKITVAESVGFITEDDDPFELDGATYGIAYRNGEINAASLATGSKTVNGLARLTADQLTVRPDILDKEGYLLASGESDAIEFTFESISQNVYYITTQVDGVTKYLTIRDTGVTLEAMPDAVYSQISIATGMGLRQGTYIFYVQDNVLTLIDSKAGNGFGVTSAAVDGSYMHLIEKSKTLTDDDFVVHRAYKVNVADRVTMHNKQKVVMYTRVWNETSLNYDYYLVDYNGKLVRCYESGNTIEWIGGQINTELLEFTEYYYEGTIDPNFYYELQNLYTGQYVAPEMNASTIWSPNTIGVNMNGRRYGQDFTTIIAWDTPYYDYAGLKIEDGEVVPCPWSVADDFYFAVLDEDDHYGEITTVSTVDNTDFGITMRMVDFNEGEVDNRNIKQAEVLGPNTNNANMVSRNLAKSGTTAGFPDTNTAVTGQAANSLYTLFGPAYEVNNLFILEAYEEGGYFEFDSTKHFAYLGSGTNFTVYDQLVSIETSSFSMEHSQFMPYNWLVNPDTGEILPYSSMHPYNMTTTTNNELPDTNPRKGERMYGIPKQVSQYPATDSAHPYSSADYFFGMQLEASFTQTPSGLDAWGHDIIFEFSGDDDFWLYVDGKLVLDLGGVHSAMTGSVNFKTGQIVSSRGNTNLWEAFKLAYLEENPSATTQQVSDYLDGIFELNSAGNYVFRDYSAHDMKMFYMERGSGASNLHMRFNLTSSRKGYVTLSKNITGTDSADYDLAEFPYQVYYKTTDDEERDWHLLDEMTGDKYNVVYEGQTTPVPFSSSYTPPNGTDTYSNVFFLKPMQSADIKMPENATVYYIVECGVSDEIYDTVSANGVTLTGVDTSLDGRSDYAMSEATADDTPRVTYVNHVRPEALRNLTITKKLYDADGVTLLSSADDATTFDFRLYLGSEDAVSPTLAYMRKYYVKNEDNQYCTWDVANQCFVSTGETLFSNLTDEQKLAAGFTTSANGAISKIPVGYSIEVRGLLIGSKFMVVERSWEVPKGYVLRELDGYTRIGGSYIVGDTENAGTVRANSDPAMEVRNQRGWGLSVEKQWADDEYVTRHAPIYVAVYADGTLVPGTIKELANGKTSAYWFFQSLQAGVDFEDYLVYEVLLTGTVETDSDGNVTSYGTLTRVENNSNTTVGAVPKGETELSPFVYSVIYDRGDVEGENDNLRTDIIQNQRAGIQIIKTDMVDEPLANGVFTISDDNGQPIGSDSYTSDANGIVTVIFVGDGDYTLAETQAPSGYVGLLGDVTITMNSGTVTLSGDDATNGMCVLTTDANDQQVIQVKNKPFTLKAMKFELVNDVKTPLAGATFAIYRQVLSANGTPRKDYVPLMENLTSDGTGLIVGNLQSLEAGTYYLSETSPPQGYEALANDVCFTIQPNGVVTVETNADRELITTESNGVINYEIDIINTRGLKKIRLVKVDRSLPTTVIEGASFALYGTTGGVRNAEPIYGNLVSDSNGILKQGSVQVLELANGVYHLVETHAPPGYIPRTDTITITITDVDVTYDEGSTLSQSGSGKSYDNQTQIYTLKVSNETGYELPGTGGNGVGLLYRYGWVLLAGFALLMLPIRRHPKKAESL